jgi:hypothetical protein
MSMGGWVIFAIFIGIALISALSHVLKGQQQSEQAARPRRKNAAKPRQTVGVADDAEQDRFLAEIERLRKKSATPKPVAKAVKPAKRSAPSLRQKLEEIPAATVIPVVKAKDSSLPVMTQGNVAVVAKIATIADVVKPAAAGTTTAGKISGGKSAKGADVAASPFGDDLKKLLATKDAMPMAVVLAEILGPPKSRRA